MNLQDLLKHSGKGPGFFGFAVLCAVLGGLIVYFKPDGAMGFAAILTPVCAGFFGGGATKAWAESKSNGETKGNG